MWCPRLIQFCWQLAFLVQWPLTSSCVWYQKRLGSASLKNSPGLSQHVQVRRDVSLADALRVETKLANWSSWLEWEES